MLAVLLLALHESLGLALRQSLLLRLTLIVLRHDWCWLIGAWFPPRTALAARGRVDKRLATAMRRRRRRSGDERLKNGVEMRGECVSAGVNVD